MADAWFYRKTVATNSQELLELAASGDIDAETEVMSPITTAGQWYPATKIKQLRIAILARADQARNFHSNRAEDSFEPVIASSDFDSASAFEFKGDYLGMHIDDFKNRHRKIGADGSILPLLATDVLPNQYQFLDFEPWMKRAGIITCRLHDEKTYKRARQPLETIASVPKAIYTFVDQRLTFIHIEIANDRCDEVLSVLLARQDVDVDVRDLGIMLLYTWEKPEATLVLNSPMGESPGPSTVRYIHKALTMRYNSLRERFHPQLSDL